MGHLVLFHIKSSSLTGIKKRYRNDIAGAYPIFKWATPDDEFEFQKFSVVSEYKTYKTSRAFIQCNGTKFLPANYDLYTTLPPVIVTNSTQASIRDTTTFKPTVIATNPKELYIVIGSVGLLIIIFIIIIIPVIIKCRRPAKPPGPSFEEIVPIYNNNIQLHPVASRESSYNDYTNRPNIPPPPMSPPIYQTPMIDPSRKSFVVKSPGSSRNDLDNYDMFEDKEPEFCNVIGSPEEYNRLNRPSVPSLDENGEGYNRFGPAVCDVREDENYNYNVLRGGNQYDRLNH